MAGGNFSNVRVVGIAGCVPPQTVNNREKARVLGDKTVDRIIDQTGVEQMHKTLPEQTAGDLGYIAANHIFKELKTDKNDVGGIVMVTGSPDYIFPGTSYVLHKRLQMQEDCMCMDINLQCSGFVYGMHVCSSLLQSMKQKYILLVVAEAFKNDDVMLRDKPDNSLAVLSGDAGTAILLERIEGQGEVNTDLYSKGDDYRMMIRMGMARGYGIPNEVTEWSDGKERSIYDPFMDGMNTFGFSTRKAPEAIRHFMSTQGKDKDDYDLLVLHQANKMIVNRIVKLLGWDKDKAPLSISKYGNTSCASIPVTIIDTYGESKETSSKKIIACGFGSGCSWGVVSFEIVPRNVFPMIVSDAYFEEGIVKPY
ncbi:MAG: ketoacyl-ACP synthase III [Pseudobutyrivibrio sp.]|nr:ketoacyl-ACP synthase III [Pseudobutyrivibrio sp.]